MSNYLFPIKIALIFFPIVSGLITLPLYIHQYRKYGYVNKLRLFAIYVFVLYLLCAYFQIILPLPYTQDIISLLGVDRELYRLELFASIKDILRETQVVLSSPTTYLHLFQERAFLQVVLNIALTVPFGVFMRYLFHKNFRTTIVLSFLLATFFEVSQLTGIFGLYNAPYRLFEVDDFIWNTIGGAIGFIITPFFAYFIPTLEEVDKKIKIPCNVGLFRRIAALAIDWISIEISLTIINLILRTQLKTCTVYVIAIAICFVVVPYFSKGYTLGKFLLGIRLESSDQKLLLRKLVLRTGVFYFFVLGVNQIMNVIFTTFPEEPFIIISGLLCIGICNLVLFINFIMNIRSHVFFHDKLSNIQNIVAKPSDRNTSNKKLK